MARTKQLLKCRRKVPYKDRRSAALLHNDLWTCHHQGRRRRRRRKHELWPPPVCGAMHRILRVALQLRDVTSSPLSCAKSPLADRRLSVSIMAACCMLLLASAAAELLHSGGFDLHKGRNGRTLPHLMSSWTEQWDEGGWASGELHERWWSQRILYRAQVCISAEQDT